MVSNVISLPSASDYAGFTSWQFRKLDQLYCMAVGKRTLGYRTVDCNFDDGTAHYTYYISGQNTPFIQFVIRKTGPRTTMYEVFKQDQGRIIKSGLFERAYETLLQEISSLET